MFHVEHQVNYSVFSGAEQVQELYSKHSSELSSYIDQLLWWNKKVNLISRDVSRETLQAHVEHSLSITTSELFNKASKIIDAGTGGGLPGIPLGIVYPEVEILLNDIVSKKIMACKQMILKLGLKNLSTYSGSIQNVDLENKAVVVSKHAFKINDLIDLLGAKSWSGIVLLKGANEVEGELDGVEIPLKINVVSLESFGNSFYDGKSLVEITRK